MGLCIKQMFKITCSLQSMKKTGRKADQLAIYKACMEELNLGSEDTIATRKIEGFKNA